MQLCLTEWSLSIGLKNKLLTNSLLQINSLKQCYTSIEPPKRSHSIRSHCIYASLYFYSTLIHRPTFWNISYYLKTNQILTLRTLRKECELEHCTLQAPNGKKTRKEVFVVEVWGKSQKMNPWQTQAARLKAYPRSAPGVIRSKVLEMEGEQRYHYANLTALLIFSSGW